jgi:hypothetical protein
MPYKAKTKAKAYSMYPKNRAFFVLRHILTQKGVIKMGKGKKRGPKC